MVKVVTLKRHPKEVMRIVVSMRWCREIEKDECCPFRATWCTAMSATEPPHSPYRYDYVVRDRQRLLIIKHLIYVSWVNSAHFVKVLGYDVDVINSVQFSNHTGRRGLVTWCGSCIQMKLCSLGYKEFKGQVLNSSDLSCLVSGLGANSLLHYSHMLTGGCGLFLC